MSNYINISKENIATEHVCCAIAGMKHQAGVDAKREWLASRVQEGHVFRKLNENGKVFIEYAPLETAWVPVVGDNYLYIYCQWVSGKFKGHGHGKALLEYCINDAKAQKKSGVCVVSSQKKSPFLTDKKFMVKNGFEVVDTLEGGYELLALSFDGSQPQFAENARQQKIDSQDLTIYYGLQCPFIPHGLKEVTAYCSANNIPLNTIAIDSLEKAKALPGMFNNWAIYYKGHFQTIHMMNEGQLKKFLAKLDD